MNTSLKISDDYEKFVTTWQNSSTLDEAAKQFGIPRRKASTTAAFLRRRGVTIKRFPRGKVVDYLGLNVIAKKIGQNRITKKVPVKIKTK